MAPGRDHTDNDVNHYDVSNDHGDDMSGSSAYDSDTSAGMSEGTSAGDHNDNDDHSSAGTGSTSLTSKKANDVIGKSMLTKARRSKALILVVIALSAIIIGSATYFFSRNEEIQSFNEQYQDYATEILDAVYYESYKTFRAVRTFSDSITSFTEETNTTWPYVTIPDFEMRGYANHELSNADQITLVPLVQPSSKMEWEQYAVEHQQWIQDAVPVRIAMQEQALYDQRIEQEEWDTGTSPTTVVTNNSLIGNLDVLDVPPIPREMWKYSIKGIPIPQDGPGLEVVSVPKSVHSYFGPVWQQSPAPITDPTIVNFDLLTHPVIGQAFLRLYDTQQQILSQAIDMQFLYHGRTSTIQNETIEEEKIHPESFLLTPIYEHDYNVDVKRHPDELVGLLVSVMSWEHYLENILPNGTSGVVVVMYDTCNNRHFTYEINGQEAVFMGMGDLHDPDFDDMVVNATFAPFMGYNNNNTNVDDDTNPNSAQYPDCEYKVRIYPSAALMSSYETQKPGIFTAVVVMVFFLTAMVFVLYDMLIQARQDKVMATAIRTNEIVSSLFPSNVRDRIMKDAEEQAEQELLNNKNMLRNGGNNGGAGAGFSNKAQLKTFLMDDDRSTGPNGDNASTANGGSSVGIGINAFDTKPIADLFPETTVMYADLVGFTAWSSVREPSQVFTLLETVYHSFDEIAKRRRVFKVETIGDCYVAVTGLPDPRKDHAISMCRFAKDCLVKMNSLMKQLEVTLGPDTGDLTMRFGLHSGPVTAGVLRGDKSRFQLFGDTVNLASRIESTGARDRIHLSQETAELLVSAGKGHWIVPREDKVDGKDKGELQTYWLVVKTLSGGRDRTSSIAESSNNEPTDSGGAAGMEEDLVTPAETIAVVDKDDQFLKEFNQKTGRLVDWNVEVLARLLRQVVARRMASESHRVVGEPEMYGLSEYLQQQDGETVLDEVKEIIRLPDFDYRTAHHQIDPDKIDLGENVMTQLHDYVTIVATMYRDNPFHNFEHASHVTMSVVKLLSRIVAPDAVALNDSAEDGANGHSFATSLHDHTYGITSDPLTQFACVFSALIHDVDHTGVPNAQLVKEKAHIATVYKNKSVAEQNSVDIAWDLLMDIQYKDFRQAIYSNQEEQKRFRQLVVNSVMATDIVDKELKNLRNARWDKAFNEKPLDESPKDTIDRKATIVIEHLIQASDIAHTMQHWHIYRKWNERLYEEIYRAYKDGRAGGDPAEFWYKGEIGFFDFYIIPLAKKLKECGVFGVSSDEYLNYASKNRKEWEQKGQEVVATMSEKFRAKYLDQEAELGLISNSVENVEFTNPPASIAVAKDAALQEPASSCKAKQFEVPEKTPEPPSPPPEPARTPEDPLSAQSCHNPRNGSSNGMMQKSSLHSSANNLLSGSGHDDGPSNGHSSMNDLLSEAEANVLNNGKMLFL